MVWFGGTYTDYEADRNACFGPDASQPIGFWESVSSRELFEKTFNDIRQNFQAMFRKLFGGGKADVILEENVDMLEAGIEIVAQPPNKALRSITLLSGGEKVMIVVALLFAVFQAKPSPFCILDEVDAALDESNINRFTHILKEFTSVRNSSSLPTTRSP